MARGQLQNHRRGQASWAHRPPWGLGASLHMASAGSALLPHRAGVRNKGDHRSGVPVSPAGVGGPYCTMIPALTKEITLAEAGVKRLHFKMALSV